MSNFTQYLLMQIASDVREIRERLDSIILWSQRIGILVLLWGLDLITGSQADKIGEALAAAIKALK